MLDLTRFNRLLLESVGVGLAIIDPETMEIGFRNPRFSEWFPEAEEAGCTLPDVVTAIDAAALKAAIEAGETYRAEIETKARRRSLTIAVAVSAHEREGARILMLEGQNISKIKELEYMVESYSRMVEKHTRDLRKEKERAEKLLLNIMPKTVYEEWRVFGVTTPQRFDAVAVLMLDFVGFTDMAISRDPPALIAELNDIFTSFDRIVEQFGGERIKTMGDAYMAVCGVPEAGLDDAQNVAKIALRFMRYLRHRNRDREPKWLARIGLNVGPVVGSIVGIQKYVYDIFGPGVNLAARMEAFAEPMEIVVSEDLQPFLQEEFHLVDRGVVDVKGFGPKRIYSLTGSTELDRVRD